MATRNVDVVLLQETNWPEHRDMRVAGYQVHQLHRGPNSHGLAILVRATIPSERIRAVPCGDGVEALAVRLTLADSALLLYSLYRPREALLEAGELLSLAAHEPVLIAGDFNAHHPALHSLQPPNAAGHHITALLTGFPEVSLLNSGEPTHIYGGRLDLTFLTAALAERATWAVDPELTSDHFAILTTLQVALLPPPPPPPLRWNTGKANWTLFREEMENWYSSYAPAQDLDDLNRDFVAALHAAAESAIPKTKPGTRRHADRWYYNDTVKEHNHRVNVLRKYLRRHPSLEARDLLRAAIRHAREVTRRVREEKWLEWCATFSSQSTLSALWGKLRMASGAVCRPPAHPQPLQRAQELAEHFAARSSAAGLPPSIRRELGLLQPGREEVIATAMAQPGPADCPFTVQELRRAKKTSRDTAPGSDCVPYSFLSNMGPAGEQAALALFNASWAAGRLPVDWKKADVVPIPKPRDRQSFRPISLTSCLSKTAERMVLNRLQWCMGHLHPDVYGYTKGVAATTCVANLLGLVSDLPAIVVFLDLEKAFEMANPTAILASLTAKGVTGNLLSWIGDYLHNRLERVRFQGHLSQYCHLANGTPQGGVLSPTLFNVLVENLLLLGYDEGVRVLCYADDIALVVTGAGVLAHKAQRALRRITEECGRLGLKVSPDKSKAMCMRVPLPEAHLTVQDTPLQWVDSYRYLGVWIDAKLRFGKEVRHLMDATRARLHLLRAMTRPRLGAGYKVLRTYYVQAVRSVVDYAAVALVSLPDSQWKKLEVLQNQALRTITAAPPWTRVVNLRQEAGVSSLRLRAKRLCACLLVGIFCAPRPCALQEPLLRALDTAAEYSGPSWKLRAAKSVLDFGLRDLVRRQALDRPHPEYVTPPPWIPSCATFHVFPLAQRKADCDLHRLKPLVLSAIRSLTPTTATSYFTDGSVDPTTGKCGAAFVTEDGESALWRISDGCSTLQAELAAISKALEHALLARRGPVVIHTDSRGALSVIQSGEISGNICLLTTIQSSLCSLDRQGRPTIIHWIPSHIGIPGNTLADDAAKAASGRSTITLEVPPTAHQIKCATVRRARVMSMADHSSFIASSTSARWYYLVTRYDPPSFPAGAPRKLESILCRLRLGYRCGWQVLGVGRARGRNCQFCGEEPPHPLRHYLLECGTTVPLRSGLRPPLTEEGVARAIIRDFSPQVISFLIAHPPPGTF